MARYTKQKARSDLSQIGFLPGLLILLVIALLWGLVILGNLWVWTEIFNWNW